MLFNTYIFIFLFLPVVLIGFHLIGTLGRHRVAIVWLIAASLFFYGWWNPAYLGLILGSMLFNYMLGTIIITQANKKILLIIGITANLALLGYFKYSNFFVESLNALIKSNFTLETIILPLAISFFTFQQIIYLVDTSRGDTEKYNFLHYALFVSFFPQLIAGPIVHHKEMFPQFMRRTLFRLKAKHLAVGMTIFAIGLFKKVVLADSIAVYAAPIFNAADAGIPLKFFDAWAGALAYSFQLYFDFSGYSDMAIGLARMFGVHLPINFNSPYKSTSIIDFWRRWHITLSRFLRDYLYIPLGGSRKGKPRRICNVMITMLLGGLWHGAGWTFVIWGGLHGLFLVINHEWRRLSSPTEDGPSKSIFGWAVTMLSIVVAWVPFRAESLAGATNMLRSMAAINGVQLTTGFQGKLGNFELWLMDYGVGFNGMFTRTILGDPKIFGLWILALFLISILFPNTQQLMRGFRPIPFRDTVSPLRYRWQEWRLTIFWALFSAMASVLAILSLTRVSEFLYFQF